MKDVAFSIHNEMVLYSLHKLIMYSINTHIYYYSLHLTCMRTVYSNGRTATLLHFVERSPAYFGTRASAAVFPI